MSQEETAPLYVNSTSYERSDRRKKFLVAGLTIVLSLSLCLAIAIPLATSGSNASSVNYQKVAPALVKSVAYAGSNGTGQVQQLHTTVSPIKNVTLIPIRNATTAAHSNTTATSAPTNNTTSGLPTSFPSSACPLFPKKRRISIDVENLNGKLMFELARIQTWNAPAYVSSISCSTMELDLERTNASGKVAANGTLNLGWNERYSFFEPKNRKSLSIPLQGVDSPYDWFEATPSGQAHLSILAEIDQYVLTYECFPETTFPGVAYVVHLYSYLPQRGTDTLGEALLWLANAWGLNPAAARIVRIQQSGCDYNIV